MSHHIMSRRFAGGTQRGLTLLELLVSLTIGLLVTVAAASVYLVARQGFTTNEDQSRTFETGRLVVDQLARNMRMGGAPFFNATNLSLDTGGVRPFPSSVVDGFPIVGVEGGAAPDSFSIAYANIDTYSATTLLGADCQGTQIVGGGTGQIVVNSFFITAAPLPRLACVGNGATAGATGATVAGLTAAMGSAGAEPIADQVVDMQVMYGIDSAVPTGSAVLYVNANGVAAAGGWGLVRSADICLDVASLANQNIPGAKTPGLNCQGVAFPADGQVHRLFRFTVNRRNQTTGNIIPGPP